MKSATSFLLEYGIDLMKTEDDWNCSLLNAMERYAEQFKPQPPSHPSPVTADDVLKNDFNWAYDSDPGRYQLATELIIPAMHKFASIQQPQPPKTAEEIEKMAAIHAADVIPIIEEEYFDDAFMDYDGYKNERENQQYVFGNGYVVGYTKAMQDFASSVQQTGYSESDCISRVNDMCIESLSPEHFANWEAIKKQLKNNSSLTK